LKLEICVLKKSHPPVEYYLYYLLITFVIVVIGIGNRIRITPSVVKYL
jgi:hypothetical protein